MGAGHGHRWFVHGHSLVHQLAPEAKVAATVLFVFAVVATPKDAFWAFGLYAGIVVVVAFVAGVPLGRLAARLVIELPFLAFALFLPFIGQGEEVQVGFLSLSVAGLWGAWNILVKGTLGVAATALLGATTTVPELLRGLERLHMPRAIVGITSFMVRYGEVITDDLRRMKVARQSRVYDPRWLWQVKAVATSAGALFIRSYERGERVYVSMLSRGYDGAMPALHAEPRRRRDWLLAMSVPAVAAVICVAALVTA